MLTPAYDGRFFADYRDATGFVAFDTYKTLLTDSQIIPTGPATVLAGFAAGATESIIAVTPFESIKTQLIDDRKSPNPRMKGFIHGSGVIWREKGIRGFFQGFVPTTARQAANSAVRFSSYTSMKQMAQSYVAPGEKLGTISTFALGAAAGTITVYTTMPLDTVKTRMQSIEAKKEYRNSFNCAARIFREEGLLAFWSGALPRLGRLMFSGGIVFAMSVQPHAKMEICTNFQQVRKDDGYPGQHRSRAQIHMMSYRSLVAFMALTIILISRGSNSRCSQRDPDYRSGAATYKVEISIVTSDELPFISCNSPYLRSHVLQFVCVNSCHCPALSKLSHCWMRARRLVNNHFNRGQISIDILPCGAKACFVLSFQAKACPKLKRAACAMLVKWYETNNM